MKNRRVLVTQRGAPERMQVIEEELPEPSGEQVRLKVLAAPVSAPDVTARLGQSPILPRLPFTPGYAVVGVIEECGAGVAGAWRGAPAAALTVTGGYSEHILLPQRELIPLPEGLDPAQVAPLVMNYLVAYQCLHRWAHVQPGETALVIGASGGIGSAFLQLGRLAGLKLYGLASASKHDLLRQYGAIPIDYRQEDFAAVLRRLEPQGIDCVFDGMAGEYIRRGFAALRRGGRLVCYGNPLGIAQTLEAISQVLWLNLLPNGRSASYYSTGTSRLDRLPFMQDWATLFRLLQQGQIQPVIAARFPILQAARANALLKSGQIAGNVVLLAPELISPEA
jgi:NADPH2:quinone reductase